MGLIRTSLIAVGGVTVIGAAILAYGPLSSYLRTGARLAGAAAHDAVPAGFEIERIQTMVGDLDQVIAELQGRLVKQRVDLDYLKKDVKRCQERVDASTAEVGAARDLLSVERASYRINGQDYTRNLVMREAQAKAESLNRSREIASAKEKTAAALEAALAAAEDQLAKAKGQRQTYALRLANLKAQAETVAIRKELATQLEDLPKSLDTGAFAEVEQAFTRIERELTVQSRILDESGKGIAVPSAIQFTAPETTDVIAQLDAALGRSAPPAPPALATAVE